MPRRRTGFTTRATCLLAAGATALLCGLLLGERDLLRAGLFAVAVPVVAAALVHRSQLRIANRRAVEPTEVFAGQPVTVSLTITNRSVLRTGALMLEDALPDTVGGKARFVLDPMSGNEKRTVTYRLPNLGRGRYRAGPLRIRLRDAFRMVDLTRSFTGTSEFVVSPVVEPLPPTQPPRSDEQGDNVGSRSIGSYGADDQSTREYRTGDDLRKIHWRSSARTGALMVRQEERPWQGHITVLLDNRASAHERVSRMPGEDLRLFDSFEWAVSAAASIGTHVLTAGRRLGLVRADTQGVRGLTVPDAAFLARHLAELREAGMSDLGGAARSLRAADRDSTVIAVLGRLDAVSLRELAQAHARGRSTPAFALLLDVDSWRDVVAVESVGAHSAATQARSVAGSAAVLISAGWRVAVVRRDDSVAQAWRLLMAGVTSGVRPLIEVGR